MEGKNVTEPITDLGTIQMLILIAVVLSPLAIAIFSTALS